MGVSPDSQDRNKRTPIHIAAAGGYLEVLQSLIEGKADLNPPGCDYWTPAMRAAQRGKTASVQLLYEAQADLTKTGQAWWSPDVWITPIFIAACNGYIHTVKYIAEKTNARDTAK